MKTAEKVSPFEGFTSIAEIVVDSFRIFSAFKVEYANFRRDNKCNFYRIDRLEKDLFDLKEATHALFRLGTEKKEIKETDLYDLIVSSIFHEMLHLKEYIYILDKYEPSFNRIEKRLEDLKNLEDFKKDFLRHSREMVGEAKLGLPLKIQGINEVVDDALKHLGQIIRSNSFDGQLIRSIYTSSDLIDIVYGENGIETLYTQIYEGGWIEGYFLVAESFEKSGFCEEAANILRKIINRAEQLDKAHPKFKVHRDFIERAKLDLKNLEAKMKD